MKLDTVILVSSITENLLNKGLNFVSKFTKVKVQNTEIVTNTLVKISFLSAESGFVIMCKVKKQLYTRQQQ